MNENMVHSTIRPPYPESTLINSQIHPDHCDFQLFLYPWCPLFGDLLSPENNPALNQVNYERCLQIISDGRFIWNVPDFFDYSLGRKRGYPDQRYLPPYPKDKLQAARMLFKKWDEIQSFIDVLRKEITLKEAFKKGKKLFQIDVERVEDVKKLHPAHVAILENLIREMYTYQCSIAFLPAEELLSLVKKKTSVKTISSAELFALVAILEAWKILRRILIDGEEESKPEIAKAVTYSEDFLERAKAEQIKYAHKVEAEPAFLTGKKIRRGLEDARRESALVRRTEQRDKKLQEIANKLWDDFPSYAIGRISTKMITSGLNQGLSEGRLRRIIKKPDKYR